MTNNNVAGYPGYRITQVQSEANLSLSSMPNVVLLHVGSMVPNYSSLDLVHLLTIPANDMAQNYSVSTAHVRLATFIDQIFSSVHGVSIVVSTLLPNANPYIEANARIYNANLPGVVSQRAAKGKKITLVDMHANWFSTADLRADGTHPTDFGYLKMAKVFYNGIAALQGQITPPVNASGVNDSAANAMNDPGAGTALNVVCQTQPKQVLASLPSAQLAQCGWSVAAAAPLSLSSTQSISSGTTPIPVPTTFPLLFSHPRHLNFHLTLFNGRKL